MTVHDFSKLWGSIDYHSIVTKSSEPPSTFVRHGTRTTALDSIDLQILSALAADCRLPINALALSVGVAPSTCSLRVRRLHDTGAIRGFHADVAPEAVGLPIQAMVAVRVQPAARARIGEYTTKLAALPGVLNVYFLAGSVDFLIQVAAESPHSLRLFVTEHLSASKVFTSTETSLVFEHVRGEPSSSVPNLS